MEDNVSAMADTNHKRSRAGARDDGAGREPTEDSLEQWGRRVGRFVAGAAARVREEAEDIWAEAQSVRRGERD